MGNRYNSNDLYALKDRMFFFDTNVLMYLYYSQGSGWLEAKYTKLFSSILTAKLQIVIDSNVISEFINAAIRLEYKKTASTITYKDYRNSENGQNKIQDIYNIMMTMLATFEVVDNVVDKLKIQSLLVVDSLDFNDKLIENLCARNNYVLITNDIDYKNSKVDILSLNKKM